MQESIEIIDISKSLEADDPCLSNDDENSVFSVCIISCIDFKKDFSQSTLEKYQSKLESNSSLGLSSEPWKINVITGTPMLKDNYINNIGLTDKLVETVILTLVNKAPLSAILKKSDRSNQSTQTEFDCLQIYSRSSIIYPNIFFCTFHENGDVETLCNLNCSHYVNYDESVDPYETNIGLEITKKIESRNGSDFRSSFQLDKADLQFIENIDSGTNTNKADLGLENNNGTYLLRNNEGRKCKKWDNISEDNCSKFKSLKYNILICEHCNVSFSSFTKLEQHSKLVHNLAKVIFKCKKCIANFTKPHNLIRHIYAKHTDGIKRVSCDICGREFSRQDVLLTHKRLMHSDNISKEKNVSKWCNDEKWCSGCKKLFFRYQNFKLHQSGNLKCSKCSNVYLCRTALKSHLDKDHLATCSICENIFTNERQLNLHKLKHSPKHKCKYCNKGFSLEYQLTIHLATHTGVKPLMCEICGRSFAHKNSLHKHKWQEHTEANKKFKCLICGRGFVYMAKLKSHLKSHSGNKPFVCHICPSSFSQKCSLAAHIKGIHGVYLHNEKKNILKGKISLTNKKIVSVSLNDEINI